MQCDNRDKFGSCLEGDRLPAADPKEPGGSSLLQQTLEQHQKSHLKYKHLVENAPDAIFIADTETGIILEANNEAAKLLGIPLDQIVGMHQSQIHPPEETQKYTD